MKYYLWIEVVGIVLTMLSRKVVSGVALFDCYIFICSYSLYKDYLMGYPPENAVNTSENTIIKFDKNVPSPLPLYNSCENDTHDTQPQTSNANPFKEG